MVDTAGPALRHLRAGVASLRAELRAAAIQSSVTWSMQAELTMPLRGLKLALPPAGPRLLTQARAKAVADLRRQKASKAAAAAAAAAASAS